MFYKQIFGGLAVTGIVLAATFASDASAGCRSGYGYGYRYTTAYAARAVYHAPPVAFAELPQEQLPSVPVGSTITLPANFLGPHPGSVLMVFNNIKLPVQVVNWTNEGVTVTLPPMALRHPVKIRVDVVLPHGKLGLRQRILVTPPADVVLHPVAPTSPLPTNAALSGGGLLNGELFNGE